MISRMFGAPLGGTTRAGQYGVDCAVFRPIFPSNFCGGGGSCFPSMVVVAQGEPGGQFVCWAAPNCAKSAAVSATADFANALDLVCMSPLLRMWFVRSAP